MALLHKTLAENLLLRIQDPEAKSADLNVARQFLKDNGIDALAVEGSPLSDLVATLPDFSDADFDVSELKAHLNVQSNNLRIGIPIANDPLSDFRKFLFVIWKHLNLPDPTPVQYDIAYNLQHGDKRMISKHFEVSVIIMDDIGLRQVWLL